MNLETSLSVSQLRIGIVGAGGMLGLGFRV